MRKVRSNFDLPCFQKLIYFGANICGVKKEWNVSKEEKKIGVQGEIRREREEKRRDTINN